MIKTNLPIYLASKSPRRRKLLRQINIEFKSFSVDVEEKIKRGEKPSQSVKRLAREKLAKAREKVNYGIIITADTIVVLDSKIIGKPEHKSEAKKFLKKLSGRVHTVYTGFSVFNSEKELLVTDYEKTLVEFRKLSQNEIDDFGAVFIKRINGCYYNVVGLPLPKVYQALMKII